jgi:hypothetical protein
MALCGLLAGCGGNATGVLTGTLSYQGGSPTTQNDPGIVKVLSGGQVVASHRLFSGQTFRFHLTPGKYQLGSTGGCSSSTVTVEVNSTTTSDVFCVFH